MQPRSPAATSLIPHLNLGVVASVSPKYGVFSLFLRGDGSLLACNLHAAIKVC